MKRLGCCSLAATERLSRVEIESVRVSLKDVLNEIANMGAQQGEPASVVANVRDSIAPSVDALCDMALLALSERKERSELEKKIAGFSILPDGWDSYGAKAFTPRTIALAMEMAGKLGDDWKAVPCGDGTIEFYRGDENDILWVQTNE